MSTSRSVTGKHRAGVSLDPEVLHSLDELVAQTGLNRSWILNTIVREYFRLVQQGTARPLDTPGAIISFN